MKKFSWIAILMVVALLAVAGCTTASPSQTADEKVTVNVAALNGPTGIGMVKLWDDDANGTTQNDYNFTFSGVPTDVVAMVTSGEVDIAAVPINVAATLYNKTNGNVLLLALNTGGVLYVLENGDSVNEIGDLAGKTIYATGQGSTPEFVLDYILDQNGIDGITIEYKAEHSELAALMITGDVTLGMLPEPLVTNVLSKNADVRVALDLNAEWLNATAAEGNETELSMGVLVVRKAFAEENPQAVAAFMSEYAASVAYVNNSVAEAAVLVESAGIMPSAALAEQAIPNCNIVCITGEDMEAAVTKVYEVLFAANPQSIGGAMPEEDFFYDVATD